MAKQVITLHMYESTETWDAGRRMVINSDYRLVDGCMKGKIHLGSQEVEIDWPEIDTRQAQIDALEAEIKQERGESEYRVNLLLERLSKLRAIGHD